MNGVEIGSHPLSPWLITRAHTSPLASSSQKLQSVMSSPSGTIHLPYPKTTAPQSCSTQWQLSFRATLAISLLEYLRTYFYSTEDFAIYYSKVPPASLLSNYSNWVSAVLEPTAYVLSILILVGTGRTGALDKLVKIVQYQTLSLLTLCI